METQRNMTQILSWMFRFFFLTLGVFLKQNEPKIENDAKRIKS